MMAALSSARFGRPFPGLEDVFVGSFGDRLQREREMRGISLEEIAEATKIGTRSLRALEEQDFDKLPGGIFNKGFVRAYARYLGLDEEQAVADYLAALGEAQAAAKTVRQEPGANAAVPDRNIFIPQVEDSEPMRLPLGPIAVVVVVAVLLFSGWRYYTRHGLPNFLRHVRAAGQLRSQPPAKAAAVADASRSATNPVQPAPDASRSGAHAVPAKGGFVVRVKAKEDSWISVVADGKPVMSAILPKESEKSVRAQQSVVLKIGNSDGVELYYNGKLMPPLSPDGKVKTLEFTPAGLRP
jgi:cytoskeleton protein RodZ